MRKLIPFLVLCLSFSPQMKAEIIYRPDEGWSSQNPGEEQTPAAKSAQEQFGRAQAFENSGDLDKAIKAYQVFVKKFSYSSHVAEAQWKVAELTEKTGNDNKAYDAYDAYIKKYPRGENFDRAVQAQFNIATRYLNGEKVKVLIGLKLAASMTRAQKMFETIIANASYS